MIYNERMTAQIDGEFVVFLIGMRINKPWMLHKLLPVFGAMPKMLRELYTHPELGLLHHEMWFSRRGCTEFCVNGQMAGNRRTSRSGYDRKYKESSTQRPH